MGMTKARKTILALVAVVLGAVVCAEAVNSNKVIFAQVREEGKVPYVKNEDGTMIPDKYNTGVNPNMDISKVSASKPGSTFTLNEISLYRGYDQDENRSKYYGSDHLLLDWKNFKTAPSVVTIENIDFSDFDIDFLCGKNTDGDKKLVFKNCKFRTFKGDRVHNKNTTFEFYDCEFEAAHGSYMKFERCKFHPTQGDAMDIFSDIDIKDSYIFSKGDSDSGERHVDGFQTFGKAGFDVANIHFSNVRIELPKIKTRSRVNESQWFIPAVNAPIMVQVERSTYAHDINLENMHINGGGYSVYWTCIKDCVKLSNTVARNIQVGYGHMFNIMHPNHDNLDDATSVFDKLEHLTLPYIGSAWKSSTGVHVSVTNELLSNRTMVCVSDKNVTTTHTIPAHPKLIHKMAIELVPEFDDLPYDIDLVVANENSVEVSCYDVTETGEIEEKNLIKIIRPSYVDAASSLPASVLLVILSVFIFLFH